MTNARAQEWIIVAALLTVGSTTSSYLVKPKNLKKQIPDKRIKRTIISGFAAMFVCSLIAEVNPQIGVSLAGFIAGGVFIEYGLPTILQYYEGGKK